MASDDDSNRENGELSRSANALEKTVESIAFAAAFAWAFTSRTIVYLARTLSSEIRSLPNAIDEAVDAVTDKRVGMVLELSALDGKNREAVSTAISNSTRILYRNQVNEVHFDMAMERRPVLNFVILAPMLCTFMIGGLLVSPTVLKIAGKTATLGGVETIVAAGLIIIVARMLFWLWSRIRPALIKETRWILLGFIAFCSGLIVAGYMDDGWRILASILATNVNRASVGLNFTEWTEQINWYMALLLAHHIITLFCVAVLTFAISQTLARRVLVSIRLRSHESEVANAVVLEVLLDIAHKLETVSRGDSVGVIAISPTDRLGLLSSIDDLANFIEKSWRRMLHTGIRDADREIDRRSREFSMMLRVWVSRLAIAGRGQIEYARDAFAVGLLDLIESNWDNLCAEQSVSDLVSTSKRAGRYARPIGVILLILAIPISAFFVARAFNFSLDSIPTITITSIVLAGAYIVALIDPLNSDRFNTSLKAAEVLSPFETPAKNSWLAP